MVERLATVAVRLEMMVVMAFKMLVAKLPVTVRFEAVVDPMVDDPDTAKFPAPRLPVDVRLETVVEANVEEPVTDRF